MPSVVLAGCSYDTVVAGSFNVGKTPANQAGAATAADTGMIASAGTTTHTASDSRVFIPEGVTVRVHKPELEVRFLPVNSIPDETVFMPFKLTDNVSAVKGLAVERLKERFSMNVEIKRIIVERDGKRLKDNQPLVDLVFPYDILRVTYPENGITIRETKLSNELDFETDFFSIFDSDWSAYFLISSNIPMILNIILAEAEIVYVQLIHHDLVSQ